MAQVPSWGPLAGALRERFGFSLVYDCMDDWRHFPGIGPELLEEEPRLVRTADVLSVSARRLWDKWAARSRRPVLARNAADFDRFHRPPADDPLPDVSGPIAGYYGAITSWFDVALVARLARAHPEVTFVLVGDVSDVGLETLRALPNVRFTGAQPYARMPAYLSRFDVCLVPFLITDATRAMDVVKFYEYICQGKPEVSTALPELAPYHDVLYVAEDEDAFAACFERALREDDPGLRQRRVELARENGWAQRVALLKAALAEAAQDAAGLAAVRAAVEQAVYGNGGPPPSPAERAAVSRVARELFTPEVQRLAPAEAAREARRHVAPGMLATLAGREQAVDALASRLAQVQHLVGEQQDSIEFLKRVRDDLERSHDLLADSAMEADRLRGELDLVHRSRVWRAGERFRRLRDRVARAAWRLRGGAPAAGPPVTPRLPEGFPALPLERHDVIVFSIIDWEFRFQRPQQLATQFGRHGHRTFYLSTTRFLPPRGPAWELTPKAPHVAELKLRARRAPNIYQGRLSDSDLTHLQDSIEELARDLGVGDAACMVQIPFWTPLAFRLREAHGWPVVYDCMDEWENFPGFGQDVLREEDALFARADLTVVSADRLFEKARPRARRLVLARNGVDLDHYRRRYAPNHLLDPVRHPVIGYYGALASWVDVPLLEKIAHRFPQATIVLAGGHFDVELGRLQKMANVRLLGQRPYADMPPLLWNIDVCIIPFLVNDITQATNPVKFYEYCFGEKPVVAPDLIELRPYADLCYLARSHDEFISHIEAALGEMPDDPRHPRRRQVAEDNDWSARYAVIEAGLRAAREGGAEAAETPAVPLT
jgi:hypothetical protein